MYKEEETFSKSEYRNEMRPVEQDQYGFVVDFDEVKKVKQWVDENWDHAMLVSYDDEKMIRFLTDNAQKHYALKGNPTVENMCIELMAKASNLLNTERVFVSKVVIYETPTSCATLEGN
jgi:6-pyruvoyl-tetrahydropterin synthase